MTNPTTVVKIHVSYSKLKLLHNIEHSTGNIVAMMNTMVW